MNACRFPFHLVVTDILYVHQRKNATVERDASYIDFATLLLSRIIEIDYMVFYIQYKVVNSLLIIIIESDKFGIDLSKNCRTVYQKLRTVYQNNCNNYNIHYQIKFIGCEYLNCFCKILN